MLSNDRTAGYEFLTDIRFSLKPMDTGSEGPCDVCTSYSTRLFEILGDQDTGGPEDCELWVCGACYGPRATSRADGLVGHEPVEGDRVGGTRS
jgi:hypothetical protein